MKKRVTIKDISREMGVSVTTVYKALNNKPKISEALRQKITDKAMELNYTPNILAQGLARSVSSLGIIIPREPAEFYTYAKAGIDAAIHELADYNFNCIIKEVSKDSEVRDAISSLIAADVAGIIIEPNEVVSGIYKYMDDPASLKLPVISFVSEPIDGTPLIGVLRSDGYVLGRMAAQLLHNAVKQEKVAAFLSDGISLIHQECANGFIEECGRRNMNFTSCFEITNDPDTAYRRTGEVLLQEPELKGIYVASYNAVGVCKRLEDMGRTDIRVIGQDLYPELARCIERGSLEATLFQNQYQLAKEAMMAMFKYVTAKREPLGTCYKRPEIVMRSNLECYIGMY